MSKLNFRIGLTALLLLTAMAQRARATVDTIPSSRVPPPPGKLEFSFPNIPPPAFDRERLQFIGSARGDSSSPPSLITFRFFWELLSGERAYSIPIGYGVEPDFTTNMNATTTVADCPTLVGLEFTTTSPLGVTFSGTYDHRCTIPEPGSLAIFSLVGGYLALGARGIQQRLGGRVDG